MTSPEWKPFDYVLKEVAPPGYEPMTNAEWAGCLEALNEIYGNWSNCEDDRSGVTNC